MIKKDRYDAVIVGGGAAGMSAALKLSEEGYKVVILERENVLGGILIQCIHTGFGLKEFKEELAGPEYAERYKRLIENNKNITVLLNSTVIEIKAENNEKDIFVLSSEKGVIQIKSKVLIFAAGSRERNRGEIEIDGTRPAGIFTAGYVQRIMNLYGYMPGEKVVILGSGDIGLIMARRLTWTGAKVLGVIEINAYPSGLPRNISQCLNDYNIPLYLNHTVTEIYGKNRIEAVKVTPVKEGRYLMDKSFIMECDTLLLSIGLLPEVELLKKINVDINPSTKGPYVNSFYMTNIDGIFVCGNALHIHDIVDYVSEEGRRTGEFASLYLKNKVNTKEVDIIADKNVKYLLPNKISLERDNFIFMRSMLVKNKGEIVIKKENNEIISKIKRLYFNPAEMIKFKIKKEILKNINQNDKVIVSIE